MTDQDIFVPPLARALWRVNLRTLPRWKATLLQAGRTFYAVLRDATEGRLTLHAMSLVYTSLLSFVPLIAISFSVLKAFGVHNNLEPVLMKVLAPLGDKANAITGQIIGFVDRTEVGVLGAVGLAILVYTAITVIQKVEGAFNEIWHIGRQRSLARKFADYLSVLLIAPVLIFSAAGIAASLKSSVIYQRVAELPMLGWLLTTVGQVMPDLLVVAMLAFIYNFIPNTHVRLRSAFLGALVAGGLWLLAGRLFAMFVVGASNYEAIYSAFATVILFIIWLYVTWLIVLVGGAIAFYNQHPEFVSITGQTPRLSYRAAERLALAVAASVSRSYYQSMPAPTLRTLAKEQRLPQGTVRPIVNALERAGLLARTAGRSPGFVPGVPPEITPLKRVVDAVREACEGEAVHPDQVGGAGIDSVESQLDQALSQALADKTVKELALRPVVVEPAAEAPQDAPCSPAEQVRAGGRQ